MDDDTAARVYSDPLARWFVTEAYRITDTAALIGATGEHIVDAGIPLWRLAYFQMTLHPEIAGKAYTWRRGGRPEVGEAPHGLRQEARFLDSPLRLVFEQRKTVRVRLETTEPAAPVLRELKGDGGTDYVALPLIFSTGRVDALSVMSDAPGGFSHQDLDRMYLLQFAFTRIVEIHSLRDTAVYLLDAYVGHEAGQRILAGEIQRGGGKAIEAVIWYCDLRGFTRLSDRMPRDVVIALLNDYFGAAGAAVTEAGGEILKFMGDAMLAIFPVTSGTTRPEAVRQAVRAATVAGDAVAALNERRAAAGDPTIRFGLALHLGEVLFGNIGASARLDFTVIGPAVNHAARLEKLCGALDCPVVMSEAVAAHLPRDQVVPLGAHPLKDIAEPQAVYGLRCVHP
ncbi:MAG: adenylate/guanylate cyclase domain-containing protein [Pseudomonadota bacterium]